MFHYLFNLVFPQNKQIRKLNEGTQKQIRHLNEKIDVVIQQRDKVKEDLEKTLNEKILQWKTQKS